MLFCDNPKESGGSTTKPILVRMPSDQPWR